MAKNIFYYSNYRIFLIGSEFIVEIDQSKHKSLLSAQCHIDFLTQ